MKYNNSSLRKFDNLQKKTKRKIVGSRKNMKFNLT